MLTSPVDLSLSATFIALAVIVPFVALFAAAAVVVVGLLSR